MVLALKVSEGGPGRKDLPRRSPAGGPERKFCTKFCMKVARGDSGHKDRPGRSPERPPRTKSPKNPTPPARSQTENLYIDIQYIQYAPVEKHRSHYFFSFKIRSKHTRLKL